MPIDLILYFGGTCALYLLLIRPIGASPVGEALKTGIRVGLGAMLASQVVSARPDLLATFRYVAGLYLIAAAIIGVRRATAPGQVPTEEAAQASWTHRLGVGQILFGFALLVHLVEGGGGAVLAAIGGSIAAAVTGALTLTAAESFERGREDAVLADRRLRQGTGVLLLAIAVYLAWP